jgi:hypothetical protein
MASTVAGLTPENYEKYRYNRLIAESWVGKHNTTHPYTKEEQDMLILAYKAAGLEYKDLNKGDLDSEELPDTNTQSIVKPFKGYQRK